MTEAGSRSGDVLDRDVEALLSTTIIGIDRSQTGAVVVALTDPLRIAWVNGPAAALFDTRDPDALFALIFAGRGREGLASSVERLSSDGSPRLERLRLVKGFRSRTVVVALSRSRLPDGRPVVVLTMPGQDDAAALPGRDAALSGLRAWASHEIAAPPVVAAPAPLRPHRLPDEAREPAALAPPATQKPEPPLADLRERLAMVRPTRLLWQTDGEHRIVKLTGGSPDLAGVDDPGAVGRALLDLLRDAAEPAPDGRQLADLLQSQAPWSGQRLRWPLAAEGASVLVTLGASPIIDRAGRFDGFRGFGVVDFADLHHLPGRTDGPPVEAAGDAADGPATTPAADPPTETDRLPVATATEPPAPILPKAPVEEARKAPAAPVDRPVRDRAPGATTPERSFNFSQKVVALRPYQTFSPSAVSAGQPPARPETAAPQPPRADTAVPPPADPVAVDAAAPHADALQDNADLTIVERSNFHEIGRTLLAQDATQTGAPPGPQRQHADTNAMAALEALGTAVVVVGADRFLYANPGFFALTGYPSLEVLHEAGGLSHLLGGLDPAANLGGAEDRAFPVVGGDGEVIGVQGRLQPLMWSGAPATMLTLRPATDRIAQVQMLEGEIKRRTLDLSELRGMLDQVAECVLTVDRSGRILTVNRAAEQLFGYTMQQVAGEPLAMLVGPDAQVAVVDLDSVPAEGQSGLDVTGRTAAGKLVSLRLLWQVLSHGRFCVFLRDQGERSSSERELASTRERLDQVLASKPEFLARISHEIRTPMNAILGFAEVILDERFGPIGNERYRAYLKDIHESGTDVLALVNDLLDLSKMEAGRMDMRPAPLDANRIIGECVGEMQAAAHRERVIVRLSLLPHLAAALVDESAFRQIMGHILSNAVKFNEPGGQVIVSTAMNEAGAVAVRVRDTGIGMTDAEIAAAMEPFGLSRTAQTGGSGLGLPLARALIETSGATMSIRSQKGEGTLVEILLPASPAEPMRMPAE